MVSIKHCTIFKGDDLARPNGHGPIEHRIDWTRRRFYTIIHESVMQKRFGTSSIVHEPVMEKRFGTGSIVRRCNCAP